MYDIVCFGAAVQDTFIKISSADSKFVTDKTGVDMLCFEHGAKILVEDAINEVGGGGINTAIAYKYLGLNPALVTAVGQDHYAELILGRLAEHDVSDRFVAKLKGINTGFSIIVTTFKGDRTAFLYRGARDQITRDLYADFDVLSEAEWFSVSHLSGKSDEMLRDIMELKKKHPRIKIAWNPGFTQLERGLKELGSMLELTKVLIINKREAEMLCSKDNTNRPDIGALARELIKSGPEIVVISDGSEGALAATEEQVYRVSTFPSKTANTTGAGDAFLSGFVAGMYHSRGEIDVALSFGSANAAGVISQFGAQKGLLTLHQIKEKVKSTPEFKIEKSAL